MTLREEVGNQMVVGLKHKLVCFFLGLRARFGKGCGEGSIMCAEESKDGDTKEDDGTKLCEIGALSNSSVQSTWGIIAGGGSGGKSKLNQSKFSWVERGRISSGMNSLIVKLEISSSKSRMAGGGC